MNLTPRLRTVLLSSAMIFPLLLITGCGGGGNGGGGNGGGGGNQAPTATLTASPTGITSGQTAMLTWTTTNATSASIDNGIGSVTPVSGGSVTVQPSMTTTYTITAMGTGGSVTAQATVTVQPGSLTNIQHVIFMLQENRSFDTYFGMLNPYRQANGWNISEDGKTYTVDGIDDKLDKFTNYDDEGAAFMLFKIQEQLRGRHDLRMAGKLWRRESL